MHVCVCIGMYVFQGIAIAKRNECCTLSAHNRIPKTHWFFNKTPLTFSGLEHPPSGAYVTVCPTKPRWLYILSKNDVPISNFAHTGHTYRYIQIHTYAHNTDTYCMIHTHTYTRQSVSGGVFKVLPLSHATPLTGTTYPDHLIRGLGRDRRARNACVMPIGGAGGALCPHPTRAARAGAPKRVPGSAPDGGTKWSATCPGMP